MKFFWAFLFISIAAVTFIGCATTESAISAVEIESSFRRQLYNRQIQSASVTLLKHPSPDSLPAELLAQYHLFTCQPRAAYAATQKIKDRNLKSVFFATILSDLSYMENKNKNGSTPLKESNPSSSHQSREIEFLNHKLDSREVWTDEWSDLKSRFCKSRPRFSDPKTRKIARAKARRIFESLDWNSIQNPSLLSYALQVGSDPKIAKHYRKQILPKEIQKRDPLAVSDLSIRIESLAKQSDFESSELIEEKNWKLSFSNLEISWTPPENMRVEVPVLVEM